MDHQEDCDLFPDHATMDTRLSDHSAFSIQRRLQLSLKRYASFPYEIH